MSVSCSTTSSATALSSPPLPNGGQIVQRPSVSDLVAFAWAQLELLRAQVIVWGRPIGRLIAEPPTQPEGSSQITPERVDQRVAKIARAVDRAARRGVFRPKCLVRSLALHRMLERNGIHGSVIRIGVRRDGDELLAHAWVEHKGVTLIDSPTAVAVFSRLTDARLAGLSPSSR